MNITPMQMLVAELGGLYGSAVLQDISKTIELYDFYDGKGQDWNTPAGLDYKPTKKRVNLVKKLIKREAGFMFGRTPELTLTSEAAASGALDEAQTTRLCWTVRFAARDSRTSSFRRDETASSASGSPLR